LAIVKLRKRRVSKYSKYVSYQITIPKDYLEILEWREGDRIAIEFKNIEGKRGLFLYKVG